MFHAFFSAILVVEFCYTEKGRDVKNNLEGYLLQYYYSKPQVATNLQIRRTLWTAIKLVKHHSQVIFPCNAKLVDKFSEDFLPASMGICCTFLFLLVLSKRFSMITYYFHFLQKFSVSSMKAIVSIYWSANPSCWLLLIEFTDFSFAHFSSVYSQSEKELRKWHQWGWLTSVHQSSPVLSILAAFFFLHL